MRSISVWGGCLGVALLLFTLQTSMFAVSAQTPAAGTPDLASDRELKSFQFFPADGVWGDYFNLTIEPGTTQTSKVLLANTGSVVNDLKTYAVDAFTKEGGGFAAADYGTPPNEVTSWLDYPEESFSLDVGQGVELTFTVTVPEGTAPGQYITAIAAATDTVGIEGTDSLSQITRFVIPVMITVPGETVAGFEVGQISVASESDVMVIRIGLQNTGDIRVRPQGTVDLMDANGVLLTSFPIAMESIYAHDNTTLTLGVGGAIPPGSYQVRVALKDPDTGIEASTLAESLDFQGSGGLAINTPFAIGSASLAPAPAADNVQFANVEAVIANGGDPVANAQLSLVASLDGTEVERFPISQSLSLPTGDTPIATRYIPATGWTTGTWTFELLLETVEPSGAAVVVSRQAIEGSIVIP